MRPAAWRVIVLFFCGILTAFSVAQVIDIVGIGGTPPWFGLWGELVAPSSQPYNFQVTGVDPGGASDRAGLRPGDLIDIRTETLLQRFQESFGQPLAGTPTNLSVRRGSVFNHVEVIPDPVSASRWDAWVIPFSTFWLALFAAVIAWRRPWVDGNLLLAAALTTAAVGVSSSGTLTAGGSFAAPWVWVYLVLSISNVVWPVTVALVAAYAGHFARPLSRARRATTALCYILVALSIVFTGAQIVGLITLWFDPMSVLSVAGFVAVAAAAMMTLVCCIAIAASSGIDRQRACWSLVPLAVLIIAWTADGVEQSLPQSYALFVIGSYVATGSFALTPVILTYAALNRRLIDIGFVLNRALVYALVSTILIGAFILIERSAGDWFVGASHATSATIGMAVALGLGLSLRYIHRYVDRFVDHVFFRKRHGDEAALRNFAHEASYITDRSVLLERAIKTVTEHTDAEEVSILVREATGSYAADSNGSRAAINENDPGIVALRAWHRPIDLALFPDSSLRGQFAFPIVSRGELVGVMNCGTKRDHEVYAPDESDALFALTQGIGAALGALSNDHDRSNDLVAKELAALRSAVEHQESMLRQMRQTSN